MEIKLRQLWLSLDVSLNVARASLLVIKLRHVSAEISSLLIEFLTLINKQHLANIGKGKTPSASRMERQIDCFNVRQGAHVMPVIFARGFGARPTACERHFVNVIYKRVYALVIRGQFSSRPCLSRSPLYRSARCSSFPVLSPILSGLTPIRSSNERYRLVIGVPAG